jgi:phenylalanyl-tRNA synthetase alpha subunit
VARSRQGHQNDKEGCALGAKVSRLALLNFAVANRRLFWAKNADGQFGCLRQRLACGRPKSITWVLSAFGP